MSDLSAYADLEQYPPELSNDGLRWLVLGSDSGATFAQWMNHAEIRELGRYQTIQRARARFPQNQI